MFDHLISTLFPYTTLFRSVSVDHGWHGASLSLQHPMPRGATAFGWIGAGRASKVVNGAVTQLEQMADCGPGSGSLVHPEGGGIMGGAAVGDDGRQDRESDGGGREGGEGGSGRME